MDGFLYLTQTVENFYNKESNDKFGTVIIAPLFYPHFGGSGIIYANLAVRNLSLLSTIVLRTGDWLNNDI